MYTPLDASSVTFFRIAFGSILLWEVFRYWLNDWIRLMYTGLNLYFTFPGFSWVRPWPSQTLMELHFILIGVLAVMVALGLCYRLAALGMFLTIGYVLLLDQSNYLNHIYLVVLISGLMVLIPAHRQLSLDAYLKARFPAWPFLSEPGPQIGQWALWTLRLQIGLVYFYGGIAKLTPDWLQGYPLAMSRPLRAVPGLRLYAGERWVALFLSYAGLAVELAVVPLLLWRKTRWLGLLIAVSFNLMNSQMFAIGIFPWFMIAATTLFLDPDWPRALVRFVSSRLKAGSKPGRRKHSGGLDAVRQPTSFRSRQRLLAGGLIAYFSFQLLFPFRHLVYPGTVHWTEEGGMFSWHMMLRTKRGTVTYIVKDPVSGVEATINPRPYLGPRQYAKMVQKPHMILQFAHWLRDQYREQGMEEVEVYANAQASLNGRAQQRLIDPRVDLAAVERYTAPADWVLPLIVPLSPPDDSSARPLAEDLN